MATYVIGDIQGCYDSLKGLLKKVKFNKKTDVLWIAGDLVNRGPDSLKTLQYLKNLGNSAICVLGNHDLHLLALYYTEKDNTKYESLQQVLDSPDVDDILNWLRHLPLMHYDNSLNSFMSHAGFYPLWTLKEHQKYTSEIEDILRNKDYSTLLTKMYNSKSQSWSKDLPQDDRHRFIINALTRMRFISEEGALNLTNKGGKPDTDDIKWFNHSKASFSEFKVFFGHWSTLDNPQIPNLHPLDTGCLWGRSLTAFHIEGGKYYSFECSDNKA